MVMKLPKKPLEQARDQVTQYPKIVSEFAGHPQYDFDFVHHPHYDNQPRPDDGTPARQTWRFGVRPTNFDNKKFPVRSNVSLEQVREALERAGENPETRVSPRRAEPVKSRESMFSKYARLERERQGQSLEQKPELYLEQVETPNLESQQETLNLERQAQLEQRKTSVISGFKKTSNIFAEESKHARAAKELRTTYESRASERLEQQADAHMEGLRRPEFDVNTNPLAAISEHFIAKSNQNVPTRVFEREQHIVQAVRPAPSNLIRTARASGFKTSQLTSAIQRFTDPTANKAVRTGIMTGLHNSPSLSLEVQRSLEASDANFEVQRQEFLTQAREEDNDSSLSERIAAELNGGVPLEENIRKQLEAHFNTDLSKVRVHTDGKAHELAKSANAIAFTTGKDIFFQTGKYDPNSSAGFELLAHETAHTIQQASGLVSPGIDSSSNLESDAKLEGRKAVGNKGNLERQANNFNDFLLKPNLEPGIAPKTMNLEGKSVAVQREPVKTATQTPAAPAKTLNSINRTGGAHAKAGVNLRDQPSSEGKLIKNLPQTTLFFVSNELEGGWYQIKVTSSPDASVVGQTGFIPSHLVKLAPDKGAKMHVVNAGDNAIRIARKYFNAEAGFDLRFFVNVLHHINPEAIPNPSGTKWEENVVLKNFAIWIPSTSFAKTLQGVVKSGTRPDAAYDAVKDGAEAIVKATIAQLPGGQKVLDTIQSIGVNASKVLNDPGAFVSNLGKAVGQGFTGFTADLPKHLENSVVSLFTGTMGGVDLPKTWDATGVLHVGLQMVLGGSPEQKLIQAIPGGMNTINAATEAKAAFSSLQTKGFAATARQYYEGAALQDAILGGIKTYVMTTVVKQGLIALGSMFIPGAGIIQAAIKLYETVKFIWDKFNDLANTVKAITSSLADIANGKVDDAAKKITSSFVGFLGLGVGFLARVAKLDGIASKVQKLFEKIRAPIVKAFNAIVNKFKALVGKISGKPVAGDKSSPSAKPTDAPKPAATSSATAPDRLVTSKISIEGDVETHQVWAEIKAGQPIMMMASTPKEIIAHLQDFKADARLKLKADSPEFKTVSDQISASGKDVGKGIAEMRNVLKVTNPRASNTSNKVVTLPGSKVAGDADLSKIAVNTLMSVKKRMEIAFPILNQAGITVENLKHAVSLAGGIVQFMKDIAGGKTLSGIDRKKLGELWNQKTNGKLDHRAELKNMFRKVVSGNHEWIPTDLMLEVIDRDMEANKIGEIPEWVDLQNKLRTESQKVVFSASKVEKHTLNNIQYAVFQGHVGSNIYLGEQDPITQKITYVQQFVPQSKFHNELRDAFRGSLTTIKVCKDTLKKVASDWIWDGLSMPSIPLHPLLAWDNGGGKIDIHKDPGLSGFKKHCQSSQKEILEVFK
jgi:Domain of unknown function (DUF4157)